MSQTSPVDFQIMSDLHLEMGSGYETFEIVPCAPFLCLLGDIGLTIHERLYAFLERQLYQFKTVFFVLGNHEAYSSSLPYSKQRMATFRAACDEKRRVDPSFGEFVLLDQTRYDVNDRVTVLGCTLFSNVSPEQFQQVSFGLSDFYLIDNWTVEKHNDAHKSDVEWLTTQLSRIRDESPERRVMILTHHSPTIIPQANNPRHANSKISSAFITDLVPGPICISEVKVWAYGHTHYNVDIQLDQLRLCANQRGYISSLSKGFDGQKIVSI